MKTIIKFNLIGVVILIILSITGCGSTSIGDNRKSIKKARAIFYVPKSISAEKVAKGLYNAVSLRVNDLRDNENLLPEILPDKPQSPTNNRMFKGIIGMSGGNASLEMMQLDMSNAYYTVMGNGAMKTQFNSKEELYKAGIYPYKDGYKVYIYLFYEEGTEGLTGALTKFMTDSIVGGDGALVFIAQIRDKFLKEIPDAKVTNQSPSKLEKIVLNNVGFVK